jgi:predicted Mrr-cat superfamily restriction endonuclease
MNMSGLRVIAKRFAIVLSATEPQERSKLKREFATEVFGFLRAIEQGASNFLRELPRT